MSNTSKPKPTSHSLQMQDDEADRTFTVGFHPAYHFLAGLTVLSNFSPTASMIVKKREIHLLATSETLTAFGTFLMLDASAATSWNSSSLSLFFHTSEWRTLLSPSIERQINESFWIYKIAGSPDLYCLVGEDPEPIKLGEARFIEEDMIEMRYLQTDKFSFNLQCECLREILTDMAQRFHHVVMMLKSDSIIWNNLSAELIHTQENGDCIVQGVEAGEIWYLLIEWRDPRFLIHASYLTKDVQMFYVLDPDWRDWILFVFRINEKTSFLYMFRGSDSLLHFDF